MSVVCKDIIKDVGEDFLLSERHCPQHLDYTVLLQALNLSDLIRAVTFSFSSTDVSVHM
jgi:hypothetical protein